MENETQNQSNESMKDMRRERRQQPGRLFIPGGVILGMGVGFAVHNVAAGMFIGLGLGFILFAITMLLKK